VTEQELINRSKEGDMRAFEQLVRKYEPQIAATVLGMLGNCQAAEDVGQEVFIRFYNAIKRFREGSSLGTYLTRIAINLSINEMRRRKRRHFFFQDNDDDHVDQANDPEAGFSASEDREIVQKAIVRLDPNFRSVVVLRLIDGYSTKETAELLNVPVGTVLSRLSRAQEKLKEILMPYKEENA
jgi:RNA polymerase sigma-70 factor (ECF subfamily)